MKKIGILLISIIGMALILTPAISLAGDPAKCGVTCTQDAEAIYGTAGSGDGLKFYTNCYNRCVAAPITSKEEVINIIVIVTNWFAAILFSIAVLVLLYGGALYMTSSGDEGKAGKARQVITYALIGIAVAILAFGARFLVESFLNIANTS